MQEEKAHNVEPPTMTTTTQLQASHCMIMEGLVATNRSGGGYTTILPEVTTGTRLTILCCCHKKDRNLRLLKNFVKKRDWETITTYWHNIGNRLHFTEDCLLIDEMIVITTRLRQTVLDGLHVTHLVLAAMLDLCQMSGFQISTNPSYNWLEIADTARSKVKI